MAVVYFNKFICHVASICLLYKNDMDRFARRDDRTFGRRGQRDTTAPRAVHARHRVVTTALRHGVKITFFSIGRQNSFRRSTN